MFPIWFHCLAIAFVSLGFLCAVIIVIDVVRRPQPMGIMNIVWPVTALFGTVPLLVFYLRAGRSPGAETADGHHEHHHHMKTSTPRALAVAKGALHCGSGCTLGDIAAEWLAFMVPSVAITFGWQWLFTEKMFAVWVLDFLFAFILGIVFQYFAIAPMRNLSVGDGVMTALKADALSLIAWQIGMYGGMALLQFVIFPAQFGVRAQVDSAEFWFAMQIAMICGFVTSYPINWYLVSSGIKEPM
ncbi:DUF4396 domain-containing protein [Neorhizobium sp. NCHU2750]|uniref:DUF4396 domain-containing protein n=1 Tax=Neorhizobium sp. NCHU2750 TaxID=1825976 RepID=UPI000E711E17|nr:membrane protein [Neorhizobium sp. NCHU2750]